MIRIPPPPADARPPVLLTGATGTVGREVLVRLLARGRRVLLAVREPTGDRLEALGRFLAEEGFDLGGLLGRGHLRVLPGDLADEPPVACRGGADGAAADADLRPDLVIHAAGSVRFDPDAAGDPHRTNVEGTRHLLAWMERHEVPALVHVSTAYVCGAATAPAPERPVPDEVEPQNAYERSKRDAEDLVRAWRDRTGGRLSIVRPSIVVGRHDDGRIARCSGVYLAFRAAELLAERHAGSPERHRVRLRIEGSADAPLDLVPVDWVAAMIDGIAHDEVAAPAIVHLVHPSPPTNRDVQHAIERAFDIAGGRFVDPEEARATPPTDDERAFRDVTAPLRPYLVHGPRFDRTNARAVERRLGLACPGWSREDLVRLVRAGARGRERRRPARSRTAGDAAGIALYFQRHLPRQLATSDLARAASITATVRFVVDDVEDGTWTCRFESGRLAWTRRGTDVPGADFGYRTDRERFLGIVGGETDPQLAFLEGHAEIEGDLERAMMMGVVLAEFNRRHPWRPTAASAGPAGPAAETTA